MSQLLPICEQESEKFNAVQLSQLPDDPPGGSRSKYGQQFSRSFTGRAAWVEAPDPHHRG
jgi:hypothetical protein